MWLTFLCRLAEFGLGLLHLLVGQLVHRLQVLRPVAQCLLVERRVAHGLHQRLGALPCQVLQLLGVVALVVGGLLDFLVGLALGQVVVIGLRQLAGVLGDVFLGARNLLQIL